MNIYLKYWLIVEKTCDQSATSLHHESVVLEPSVKSSLAECYESQGMASKNIQEPITHVQTVSEW